MSRARVALLTRDRRLVEELRRLAAVAGVPLDVAAAEAEVRRCWRTAATVVVDAAVASVVASVATQRRDAVLLVAREPVGEQAWRDAVAIGAAHVISLPDGERFLIDRLAETGTAPAPAAAVVGCLAGHGGAGASTLAVALAVAAAAAGRRPTLVDADPGGAGLDLLLGAEALDGLRWPELAPAQGVIDPAAFAAALPSIDGIRLLSWDRRSVGPPGADALDAVLTAARRASGLVVVDIGDLPRETADVALAGCRLAVVVTGTAVRSVAAAALTAARVAAVCPDVALVVNRRPPSRLRPTEVAAALGLPLVGVVDPSAAVVTAADDGTLASAVRRGPLAKLAGQIVASVGTDERRAG